MAWRAIQDTVGRSESLAGVTDFAERLYWRLLAHSDAHGRLHGSPAKVRALCLPLIETSDERLGAALLELAEIGRIWVYEVDDEPAIQIVGFEENQPKELLRKRGESRLPAPPNVSGTRAAQSRTRAEHSRITIWKVCKIPANGHQSGTSPALGRPSPGQSRVEESREVPSSSTSTRDAARTPDDEGGTTLEVPAWGQAEPERALAWLHHAHARADVANPNGYARTSYENGGWPSEPPAGTKPVDVPTACQRIIEGQGWDDTYHWPDLLDEFERLEKKHDRRLTDNERDELEQRWHEERARRYPTQTEAEASAA